jgi:O-antigen ligase
MNTIRTYAAPTNYSAGSRAQPVRSAMRLTGVFIFLYILVPVLFGQNPKTETVVMPVALALAIVFFTEVVGLRRNFSVPAPLVWFAAYLGFSMFQMVWSPGSAGTLLLLVEIFVLALVVANHEAYGGTGPVVEYSLYLAVLCTFVYNLFSNEVPLDGRIGSTLLNANAYAQVLMFGVLFALRQGLRGSVGHRMGWRHSLALVVFVGLSLYGIVALTGSRKGIIMTIVAGSLVAVYWVWQQPIRRRLLISILVAAALAAIGYALYQSPQTARISEISSFLQGENVTDTGLVKRGGMLEDAVDLWLQRPFTGWGLDQFRNVSGWDTYSHDNYVELLANQGIVGCLLYLMIYVSALVSLARSLRWSRDADLSADVFWAIVVVLVMMGWDIGAVSYYDRLSWVVLSVAIAVSVKARDRLRPRDFALKDGRSGDRTLVGMLRGRRP